MSDRRTVKARKIIRDVRAGLSNDQIMENYTLSLDELRYVLQRLKDARALTEAELDGRLPPPRDSTTATRVRTERRCHLVVELPIYLADDVTVEGFVRDLSEGGLKTAGIPARVGEIKGLLIRPDEFQDIYPFTFDAQCRWVRPADETDDATAGFEIIQISETGLDELRKLLQSLCFADLE